MERDAKRKAGSILAALKNLHLDSIIQLCFYVTDMALFFGRIQCAIEETLQATYSLLGFRSDVLWPHFLNARKRIGEHFDPGRAKTKYKCWPSGNLPERGWTRPLTSLRS